MGTVWTVVPTQRPRIVLTFDCGANADGLPSILQTLQDKRVTRATFFMTGSWAQVYPDLARAVADAGYTIGNHTMTHPNLTLLDEAAIRLELRNGRLTVRTVTGVEPKPWFRFPYGARDARTLGLVNSIGWVAIGWSIDTLGWKGTSGGQTVETVVQRVVDGLVPGAIVLMHVGSNPQDHTTLDADALPTVIDQVRALGYRFLPLPALLRSSAVTTPVALPTSHVVVSMSTTAPVR